MTIRDDYKVQSNSERTLIHSSWKENIRLDGRKLDEIRKLSLTFRRYENASIAEAVLGRTRVVAKVMSEIVPPFPDRPNEGFLQFSVDLSPMASASFESGRPSPEAVSISRIVERAFRESRALDTEALCIIAGEKVWSIRCSIHVLDDGGNVTDAAVMSATAALLHFRRPEVEVHEGGKVQTFPAAEKEPVPLSLHHLPLSLSFGLFEDEENLSAEDLVFVDPSDREELAMSGVLTLVLNQHSEICGISHFGGAAITPTALMRSSISAAAKVKDLCGLITRVEQLADSKEREARRNALRARNAEAPKTVEQTSNEVSEAPEEILANATTDYGEIYKTFKTEEEKKDSEVEKAQSMLWSALKAAADATEEEAQRLATQRVHNTVVDDEEGFPFTKNGETKTRILLTTVAAGDKPDTSNSASEPPAEAPKAETRCKNPFRGLTAPESHMNLDNDDDEEEETTMTLLGTMGEDGTTISVGDSKTKVVEDRDNDSDNDDLMSAVKTTKKNKKKKKARS